MIVLLFELSTNSKISDAKISIRIKDDVLRFDIAMYYLVSMKVFEGYDKIGEEEFGLDLCESASPSDMIAEISTIDIIHD